ncbi:MAG: hypothetical protein JWQ96_2450 [Segetibacter sp.]|nr:hypothetical protein [Segetibacter sp.]
MLSRVAETIFWLGRYMERTNGMLQVIRTSYISSQDEVSDYSWQPLLLTYGNLKKEAVKGLDESSLLIFDQLIFNRENPSSIFNNVTTSRENARAIQDHITKEVWQCLNDYYHAIRDVQLEKQIKFADPISVIDNLIKYCFLYTGTMDMTMPRGEGFTYLNIGKFLERAVLTTDVIRIKLSEINYELEEQEEAPEWKYLLYSLYGYEQYFKIYRGNFKPEFVLQMVLQNTFYPHSILYSLEQVDLYFKRLRTASLPASYQEVEFIIGKTMNAVKYRKIDSFEPGEFNKYLLELRSSLFQIAQSFSKNYFGIS